MKKMLVVQPLRPEALRLSMRARAFGMTVAVYVPLSPKTHHLIGPRERALLPRHAIVLNTARGSLIDEEALLTALESGHLWAVGLDTFAVEPLPADAPLLRNKRTVFSPHSAALTEESLIAMGMMTARNALAGLDGALDPTLVVNSTVFTEKSHATQ